MADVENVSKTDILNIKRYYKYLAAIWWRDKPEVKKCDDCMCALRVEDGYIFGIIEGKTLQAYRLYCEKCLNKMTEDPGLVEKLTKNPNYLGSGLIQKAREFAEHNK